MKPALLVLEDGEIFEGVSFGASADSFGEVVFNTSMTGYQEVLTDPSYDGQIVAMTYPHIGNYGINSEDSESSAVRVAGFVTRDLPAVWSSWRGEQTLDDYLAGSGVPAISEVDTRRLTLHLRDAGAMRAGISSNLDAKDAVKLVRKLPPMSGSDRAANVSAGEPYEWPCSDPKYQVAAYDFGIKFNILRLLSSHGCAVTVYPAHTAPDELLASNPDGVFISNGPGDPAAASWAADACKDLIGRVPIFGICLGNQLLALALGWSTYKLRFGHRGINHPVARLSDRAIEITTQNHGFAVDERHFGIESPESPGQPLPTSARATTGFGEAELTHLNLNDYTVEGFKLLDEPLLAVQYHPEAGPGPHDARYLFEQFCELMKGN